jgi:hypothetical protein
VAVVLILLLERFRWPVAMAKLPELNAQTKTIYRMTDSYPDYFGLLELPFLPATSNAYSFLTRYHNKHTYHGYYMIYNDPLGLNYEKELRVESELRGLVNPDLIKKLKDNGLYLILINGSFIPYVYDGNLRDIWRKIRKNVLAGQELGLIKDVKEVGNSIVIVLDDGRNGQEITYPIPYFSLVGEKTIQFKIRTMQPTKSQVYFNGHLIAVKEFPAGEQGISFDVRTAPKQNQINQIRILSSHPVTVHDWLIK